jgi:hypothetical protein
MVCSSIIGPTDFFMHPQLVTTSMEETKEITGQFSRKAI